jgi:hypothetical protein
LLAYFALKAFFPVQVFIASKQQILLGKQTSKIIFSEKAAITTTNSFNQQP